MKRRLYSRAILLALVSTTGMTVAGQIKTSADTTQVSTPKAGVTSNVMLNAAADNGPREVNIGLPASFGGTIIMENGLPVTYDCKGQMAATIWRKDAGISRFDVINVGRTALLSSDVGVSVSVWTNRGSEKAKGSAEFTTNSFGLLRGDVGISGPMKNGFYYAFSAFINMDPGTFRSNISTFMDKTQIYKGVINKKYSRGQIGLQYKFAYNESINTKNCPYIYHENGTVDKLPGFRIGLDSYLEQSGILNVIHPLTGKKEAWNAMKDLSNTSHVFDLMGDHKFDNKMVLDYTLRFQHVNAGTFGPYLSNINTAEKVSETPKEGDKRYFYADHPDQPYSGLVQNSMMIASPSSIKNTIMARLELSKKSGKHHWMVGFHNWYYNVNKMTKATYGYQFEVKPNPRGLIYDQFEKGRWVRKTDQNGNRSHNAAMQYFNGIENKMALVGTEKWTVSDQFILDLGTRIEWQRVDGDWYSRENRKAAGTKWVSGQTTDVKKDWFNITGTASATWKAFPNLGTAAKPINLGFLADVMYIQQSGKLSLYSGADDPNINKCEIPGYSAGVYFNHPVINIVSKVTKIKRTNYKNNSTFIKLIDGETVTKKQTISYDVNTIGWTTDVLFKPFKGFKLHALLTLQNPKYENYEFEVFGDKVSNSGNIVRSVSKMLIEIDPSYSWNKFRLWASARYFSKEQANYPNTLVFAGRWETFAGLNYKHDKNVTFSINVVNLLNLSGAKGSITGANTTTKEQAKALYDKPLAGTYIRPFTIEVKTKVRF